MMDVSVCIVNWNTHELLRNCLWSIESKTHGLTYEIIVVDNNSTDGSAEMVSASFPRVRLIEPKENLGFARGSNLAASAASGDCVLYLNPDTELLTNALLGMWSFLRVNSSIGAVGCKLLNSDRSIQFTCASDFPSPRNELSSLLFLNRLFPASRLFSSRELNYWDHLDSREVESLSGACMMLNADTVKKLGGFDEQFFMYGEDVDLCCRIRQQGQQLHYLASETILHLEGAASKKRGRSFAPLRQRAANWAFLRKNFGLTRAAAYRAAVFLGSASRLFAAALASPLLLICGTPDRLNITDFFGKHGDLLLWAVGLKSVAVR